MVYQTRHILEHTHAKLHDSLSLNSGMQLAHWSNQQDRVKVLSDHHTLSLYIQDGYESYHKTANGWKNGGAPDHFCLMPQGQASEWDIRGRLGFVHLYFTADHVRDVATQIWDKEPLSVTLNEQTFGQDRHISSLYRLFLLNQDWHEPSQHLQISSANTLLINHVLQHYSSVKWILPQIKGGLSPSSLRTVTAYIDAHLQDALSIQDLAAIACLSPYHFAHMFKASTGQPPHQYVLQRRLEHAKSLMAQNQSSLTDIASACGFANSSHFSRRFKQYFGITPSQYR